MPRLRQVSRKDATNETVLRSYKRVIDDGFATTFDEGLQMEKQRSRAHAVSVTPEKIAARRAQVQARGRAQVQK